MVYTFFLLTGVFLSICLHLSVPPYGASALRFASAFSSISLSVATRRVAEIRQTAGVLKNEIQQDCITLIDGDEEEGLSEPGGSAREKDRMQRDVSTYLYQMNLLDLTKEKARPSKSRKNRRVAPCPTSFRFRAQSSSSSRVFFLPS